MIRRRVNIKIKKPIYFLFAKTHKSFIMLVANIIYVYYGIVNIVIISKPILNN